MKKFAAIALCVSVFVLISRVSLQAQDPFNLFDSLVQQGQFPLQSCSGRPAAFVGYFNNATERSITGDVFSLTTHFFVKNNGDSSWRMNSFDHGLKIYDGHV